MTAIILFVLMIVVMVAVCYPTREAPLEFNNVPAMLEPFEV